MLTSHEVDTITPAALAKCFDHTVLAPDHTVADVEQACAAAAQYGFATVTVAPYDIHRVVSLLAGTGVSAGGTAGIPFGNSGLRAKRTEAETCVEAGAAEVDMVLNLTAFKSGEHADARDEIRTVRRVTEGRVLKVILECCYLTDDEKVLACRLCLDNGVDFVKTSTGFGAGGATVADVALIARTVGHRARVKAAGGIRTFAQTIDMLRAGAVRIGTSAGVGIMQDYLGLRERGAN